MSKIVDIVKKDVFKTVVIVFTTLLFGLVVWRMINLSVVHDEALTYLVHVPRSFVDIFFYQGNVPMEVNNHPLNTFISKLAIDLFVDNSFFFRFAGLLGFCFYVVGVWLLAYRTGLKNNWQRVFIFSVLLSSPFVFDFMSLARGYGLGSGLLVFALACLFVYFEKFEKRFAFIGFIALALAVLANASFLYAYLSLFLTFLVYLFFSQWQKNLGKTVRVIIDSKVLWTVLPSVLLVYFLAMPFIFGVAKAGEITVGVASDFWLNVVGGLITADLFNASYSLVVAPYINSVVVLLLLAPVIVFLLEGRQVFKQSDFLRLVFLWITMMFSFVILVTNVNYNHSIYPVERAGIFLLVIFLFYTAYVMINFYRWNSGIITKSCLAGVAIILVGHFFYTFKPLSTYVWPYDAETSTVIHKIAKQASGSNLNIGIDWLLEPSINYYIIRDKLPIEIVNRQGPYYKKFDYYILFDNNEYRNFVSRARLQIIDKYSSVNIFTAKLQ